MSFEFKQQDNDAWIEYQGDKIIQFMGNCSFFGNQWWARDQWMKPGGGPEIASVPMLSAYPHAHSINEVGYEASGSGDSISVRITPTLARSGKGILKRFLEEVTLSVKLDNDRFVWTQEWSLKFLEDIDLSKPEDDADLRMYYFPHQDGRAGKLLQYADPLPCYASGPAVPMAKDWTGHPEPYCGPEAFRKSWKRRYINIMFQDPDGGYSISDLCKHKWSNLVKDNRCARPCHPKGMLYLLKENGEALAYKCDADSHYHHVCEWGMDFHYWLDIEPYMKGTVIPKGTEMKAATTGRLADSSETKPLVEGAKKIELTEREAFFSNVPAYEEPENTFTVCGLERLDSQTWNPTSEGCSWEKTGGYKDGCGCLVIKNNYSNTGSWEQGSLGPAQWGNPFFAGAKYRLSAWVKIDDIEYNAGASGPQLGVVFNQYNGTGSSAEIENIHGGWSDPIISVKKPPTGPIDWTYIELITSPCPAYVLNAGLILKFEGRGTGRFSNVRWELCL